MDQISILRKQLIDAQLEWDENWRKPRMKTRKKLIKENMQKAEQALEAALRNADQSTGLPPPPLPAFTSSPAMDLTAPSPGVRDQTPVGPPAAAAMNHANDVQAATAEGLLVGAYSGVISRAQTPTILAPIPKAPPQSGLMGQASAMQGQIPLGLPTQSLSPGISNQTPAIGSATSIAGDNLDTSQVFVAGVDHFHQECKGPEVCNSGTLTRALDDPVPCAAEMLRIPSQISSGDQIGGVHSQMTTATLRNHDGFEIALDDGRHQSGLPVAPNFGVGQETGSNASKVTSSQNRADFNDSTIPHPDNCSMDTRHRGQREDYSVVHSVDPLFYTSKVEAHKARHSPLPRTPLDAIPECEPEKQTTRSFNGQCSNTFSIHPQATYDAFRLRSPMFGRPPMQSENPQQGCEMAGSTSYRLYSALPSAVPRALGGSLTAMSHSTRDGSLAKPVESAVVRPPPSRLIHGGYSHQPFLPTSPPTAWSEELLTQMEEGATAFEVDLTAIPPIFGTDAEDQYASNESSLHTTGHSSSALQSDRSRSCTPASQINSMDDRSFGKDYRNDFGTVRTAVPRGALSLGHKQTDVQTAASQPHLCLNDVPKVYGGGTSGPGTPSLLAKAQSRVLELKTILAELERSLKEKVAELAGLEPTFRGPTQHPDFARAVTRTGPLQSVIEGLKSDLGVRKAELDSATREVLEMMQHDRDMVLRLTLTSQLSKLQSVLGEGGDMTSFGFSRWNANKQQIADELAEVEKRLQLSSLKFGEEVTVGRATTQRPSADKASGNSKERTGDVGCSKKRKNREHDRSGDNSDEPEETNEGNLGKKKPAQSLKTKRPKKESSKAEDDIDGSQPRMTNYQIKGLAGKVLQQERKIRQKKRAEASIDMEIDDAEDDLPGDQCPIPGLTEVEYRQLEGEGRIQISEYLSTGDPEKINGSIKLLALKYQSFLPQSSYRTRQLALAMHYTGHNNYRCRYHAKNKSNKFIDGSGRFYVEGIGFKPDMQTEQREEGHMNCGCPIDDVLLEFFCWKTWTARSTNPAYSMHEEGMVGILINPRLRSFICTAFRKLTRLSLDDIYKWSTSGSDFLVYTALAQIYRLVDELRRCGFNIQITVVKEQSGMVGDDERDADGPEVE